MRDVGRVSSSRTGVGFIFICARPTPFSCHAPLFSREHRHMGLVKMIQGSTKTRTRSISEKRGHSRPSMKVTKPQAPASPAKNNGKSKGSSKSTGSAGSGKDLLSSNLDVSNTITYIFLCLKTLSLHL